MAGLLVGSQGPGKMNGVAPGATVLPDSRRGLAARGERALGGLRAHGPADRGARARSRPEPGRRRARRGPDRARRRRRAVRRLRGQPVRQSGRGGAPAGHARRRPRRQRRPGRAGLRKHLGPGRIPRGTDGRRGRSPRLLRLGARRGAGRPRRALRPPHPARRSRRAELGPDASAQRSAARARRAHAGRAAEPGRVLHDGRPQPRRGPGGARPRGQRPGVRGGAGREGGRLVGRALRRLAARRRHRTRRRRHHPGRRAARRRSASSSPPCSRTGEQCSCRSDGRARRRAPRSAASRRSRPAGSRSTAS